MKKYIQTFENFSFSKSKEVLKRFYEGLKHEIRENTEMRKIMAHYLSGNKLTKEEVSFVKEQSTDLLRMLGLGALVVLPGSAIIIPALIMGAKKVNIDLVPDGFKLIESMSEEEMVNIIQDGKKIYVNYINGYPNHNKDLGYEPVDIDEEGDITLSIDGNTYSTKLKWVVGIDEVSHYEVEPHMTEPIEDPQGKIENHWKKDVDFMELLKDQGGVEGVKKKMKKKYNFDYSDIENKDQLYQKLKADQML
tara:strand:- start:4318 stop:5064 length:747 start_codon:yes stop_codon:yes gene_type:complete